MFIVGEGVAGSMPSRARMLSRRRNTSDEVSGDSGSISLSAITAYVGIAIDPP
jgi:hypothetical protein